MELSPSIWILAFGTTVEFELYFCNQSEFMLVLMKVRATLMQFQLRISTSFYSYLGLVGTKEREGLD